MEWSRILLWFIAVFLLLNAVFATLYWMMPGSVMNSGESWWNCFFFSVQTLATIGYGHLAPVSTYAHILVTIQAGLGMIIVALMTGLFFAKFSRPFAKIEFSKNMVVTSFEGKPTLMFRMVNIRRNQIIDSNVSVIVLKDMVTTEGHSFRKFIDLKLVRSRVPFFTMSMSIMHNIDPESPFYGMDQRSCEACNLEIIVTAMGTDSTYGQLIHSTHVYKVKDILWGKRFQDIVTLGKDGTRIVDFAGFHEIL